MDFDLLRTFITVSESKNFQEAARKLGITQPSVSHKMMELEEQSSLPLFQLKGKKKVLTQYGQALYRVASVQTAEFERSLERLGREFASPEHIKLRIGGRTEILELIAPELKFPGTLDMISMKNAEAVQKILSGELDMAITHELPDSADIISKKVFQNSGQFVIHEKLLKKEKLSMGLLKDHGFLKDTPCVLYYHEGHLLNEWMALIGLSVGDLNVKFISDDWRTVQRLVDQGVGFAFVPEYIKSSSNKVKGLALPSPHFPKYTYYLIYDKGLKKITALREFLNGLKF